MSSRHGWSRPLRLAPAAWLLGVAGCYTGAAFQDDPDPTAAGSTGGEGVHGEPDALLGPPPEIDGLSPSPAPGGVPLVVRVNGAGFTADSVVQLDGRALPTVYLSPGELLADTGPLTRGAHPVRVRDGARTSAARDLKVDNAAPRIVAPAEVSVAEDEALAVPIDVADFDDPHAVRVHALGLPPGATWDEPARTLRFVPDFTQGGDRWTVTILADDGAARVEAQLDVVALDTIQPPWPAVVATEPASGHVRYTLSQTTDDYLDSPGFAGRSFAAVVTVPTDIPRGGAPVRVGLHGFGTPAPSTVGSSKEIRIAPHDPDDTYWWGYARSLPDDPPQADGDVPDYTARRVLHLLEWVVRHHDADPDRAYVAGSSMGGAGAMTLGLLHARHFAYVDARLGQAIPRNHRPSRVAQLSDWWGAPDDGLVWGDQPAWDFMDLTRALLDAADARDQFLFTRHAKDDPTIHFGAAVLPSPLTDASLYDAIAEQRVGHFSVWDEGGHGEPDPVLGSGWWSSTWSPISGDDGAQLRLGHAFPAFTRSTLDDDPGDGSGNGKQDWNNNSGYAGSIPVPGDTGWTGALAGARGRFLRWDTATVIDTIDRFQVAVRLLDGDGGAPPKPGYPTTGDRLPDDVTALVDVTPRRLRAFRCLPGERLVWQFGALRGEVVADDDGSITLPELPLTTAWKTLTVRRQGADFAL